MNRSLNSRVGPLLGRAYVVVPIIVVFAACTCHASSGGAPERDLKAWVQQRIKAGRVADLDEFREGRPEKVTLDAAFLAALITNANKDINPPGLVVAVKHAVVKDRLDVRYLEAPYHTVLDCTFEKGVDFSWTHFQKGLDLSGSVFVGPSTFEGMKVDLKAWFRGTTFHAAASLVTASIGLDFDADDAAFLDEGRMSADFHGMRVGGDLSIQKGRFNGGAMFGRVRIGGVFDADGVKFLNPAMRPSFYSMHVEQSAYFSTFPANPERNQEVQYAAFEGEANFRNARIDGDLNISDTVFKKSLELNYSNINNTFYLNNTVFAGPPGSIRIRGMICRNVTTEPENRRTGAPPPPAVGQRRPVKSVLDFLSHAEYSPDAYAQFEATYRERGEPETANAIGIASKNRQLATLPWYYPSRWLGYIAGLTVGYGRLPGLAFLWSVLFVLVGCAVFSPDSMQLRDPDDYKGRAYSRFWYSLDLFTPAIKLETADVWIPKSDHRRTWLWMRFHRILGWIIVPIGLLALSGYFRN
jgi:hypothetical protein